MENAPQKTVLRLERLEDGFEEVNSFLMSRLLWTGSAVILGVFLYFALGYVYFHFVSELRWSFVHTAYFLSMTMTTVGYGDTLPVTNQDKWFTMGYGIVGICILFSLLVDLAIELSAMDSAYYPGPRDYSLRTLARLELVKLVLTLTLLIFVGAAILHSFNVYSWTDCCFWSFQTSLTVGYVDVPGTSYFEKIYAICFAFVSVVIYSVRIARYTDLSKKADLGEKRNDILRREPSIEVLKSFDRDGSDADMSDYILGMLKIMHYISDEDIAPIRARFAELDLDRRGKLNTSAIKIALDDGRYRNEV